MTRYICPECGAAGAHPAHLKAPFCHVCSGQIVMNEELKEVRQLKHYRKNSQVAVWKYDCYPYYLCGVVETLKAKGYVHVHGYDSMLFKPIKILWGNEGRQFLIDHHYLREEERKAHDEFRAEWKLRAEVLLDG